MNKIKLITAITAMLFAAFPIFSALSDDLLVNKLSQDRVKLFPVPADSKNYFFMQAIENETSIVIGDFSGVEKMIVLITDKNNDNKIDSVIEYHPLTKDLKKKTESTSKYFTADFAKLKKDIIEGTVYKGNYTDDMKSLKNLEAILKNPDTNTLSTEVYGFNVRLFETDERQRSAAVFSYGKNARGYYLQFKTDYYRKDYKTEQKPVLKYSVFCRDSNDTVVKETVENLFKVRQPGVNSVRGQK